MYGYEGIADFEIIDIKKSIEIAKEETKIDNIINKLNETDDVYTLTEIYTDILCDDNVVEILNKISKEQCFLKHLPEFYTKNKYGENVINCVQSSEYHRYGVFKHILTSIEEVGKNNRVLSDSHRKILHWTMLLHDLGKPYVKAVVDNNTDTFAGHDDMSVELSKNILDRFYFTEEEKSVILTLIKYHDRLLNEGEITYDNLKKLAEELDNKRDLFYLLIDVKDADAAAKSIDVYKKYKLTKNKYLEFANKYFEDTFINIGLENNQNNCEVITDVSSEETIVSESSDVTTLEYEDLIEEVMDRKKIITLYQPIIDIDKKNVYGYELLTRIEYSKTIDTETFLKYSEDTKRFNKVQQILFTNCIDNFVNIQTKESNKAFINMDLMSYEKYVNKPRIYDAMDKFYFVLELHGYEKYDLTSLQEMIKGIRKNNGKVSLDNFGVGIIKIEDLKLLTPDYIKLDRSIIKDILENENKQKYVSDLLTFCLAKDIKLIAVGVETKEIFIKLKDLGIKYMQGYFFAYPTYSIEIQNADILKILDDQSYDSIM